MILLDLQDLQLQEFNLGFRIVKHSVRFRQQFLVAALVVLRNRLDHVLSSVLHLHLDRQLFLERLQILVIRRWIVSRRHGVGVCGRRWWRQIFYKQKKDNRSDFHSQKFLRSSHNQWSVCVPKTSVLILRLPPSDSRQYMKMISWLSNERRSRIAGVICATADSQFTLKFRATRVKRSKWFSWSKKHNKKRRSRVDKRKENSFSSSSDHDKMRKMWTTAAKNTNWRRFTLRFFVFIKFYFFLWRFDVIWRKIFEGK